MDASPDSGSKQKLALLIILIIGSAGCARLLRRYNPSD
jgi:hypothetical protein